MPKFPPLTACPTTGCGSRIDGSRGRVCRFCAAGKSPKSVRGRESRFVQMPLARLNPKEDRR
jgi:hypothetical protein